MKTKVLDTNVILDHSLQGILDQLKEEEGEMTIVIPFKVSRELNGFKSGVQLKNYNARRSIALIESLRKSGDLTKGVRYDDKFTIKIYTTAEDEELNLNQTDDTVIYTAQVHKEIYGDNVEIVTDDLDERILASIHNVESRSLEEPKELELYTGKEIIPITDKQLEEFYSDPKNPSVKTKRKLYPNQFVMMKDSSGAVHYGIYNYQTKSIDRLKRHYEAWSIKPKKNSEGQVIIDQAMFMHLLLDPNIQFVSAIGPSGCGKTLLALAAGLEQVFNTGLYNKITIMRPLVNLDKDIGALPGDKLEKLEPWMASSFDNLEYLLGLHCPKDYDLEMLQDREKAYRLIEMGKLEIEAMAYIRGRSMHNQFIIVDDAQNLDIHQAATIITRASEGTKIVFLGDINQKQIDNPKLNSFNNGLTYIVEKFKGVDPIVGHISFTKQDVVRSKLASLGVDLL
jgi:PhoH-like ATPase